MLEENLPLQDMSKVNKADDTAQGRGKRKHRPAAIPMDCSRLTRSPGPEGTAPRREMFVDNRAERAFYAKVKTFSRDKVIPK